MPHPRSEVNIGGVGWTKAEWRDWALARRTGASMAELSALVTTVLSAWLDLQPPTTVLLYRAMAGELSLGLLADAPSSTQRHQWATTRTPATGPLTLHRWDSPLEHHHFGFLQPIATAPLVSAATIGIVLVPGLVFDGAGGRIGYGKGYYDRLLADLPWAVPVGVTTTALVVGALPTGPHDVAMKALATEQALQYVTR